MRESPLDQTLALQPQFNSDGLIPCILVDETSKQILMFAWMNDLALQKTREERIVHFWSRSRQSLWKKGETSGEMFALKAMRVDCDQDVLLIEAEPLGQGRACHTGRKSCFYRSVDIADPQSKILAFED